LKLDGQFGQYTQTVIGAAKRELARMEAGAKEQARPLEDAGMPHDAWMVLDSFERLCNMFIPT